MADEFTVPVGAPPEATSDSGPGDTFDFNPDDPEQQKLAAMIGWYRVKQLAARQAAGKEKYRDDESPVDEE